MDSFNFNYAQAKASNGSYQEAEEIFMLINSEKYKNDYIYISWLARCCKWELTSTLEPPIKDTSNLLETPLCIRSVQNNLNKPLYKVWWTVVVCHCRRCCSSQPWSQKVGLHLQTATQSSNFIFVVVMWCGFDNSLLQWIINFIYLEDNLFLTSLFLLNLKFGRCPVS